MIWGYHHFRKHPYTLQGSEIMKVGHFDVDMINTMNHFFLGGGHFRCRFCCVDVHDSRLPFQTLWVDQVTIGACCSLMILGIYLWSHFEMPLESQHKAMTHNWKLLICASSQTDLFVDRLAGRHCLLPIQMFCQSPPHQPKFTNCNINFWKTNAFRFWCNCYLILLTVSSLSEHPKM